MDIDKKILENLLIEILDKAHTKLVDVGEYEGKTFKVPSNLEVSPKWLARRLAFELKD